MKDFKEILLEKLKGSGNINNYDYDTVYWDKNAFERMITFIIYDDNITDSFFKNNPEEKIPEAYLAFYPEDEEGNDVDYNGLFEYCKGKNLKEIPIETEDVEEMFSAMQDALNTVKASYDKKFEEKSRTERKVFSFGTVTPTSNTNDNEENIEEISAESVENV